MTTAQPALQSAKEETGLWERDPLYYFVDFPFRGDLYPLGLPVEISTNSMGVIAAAQESWGPFPQLLSAKKVHVRVGVAASGPQELPKPPILRAQRGLITILSDAENFGVCDVLAGFAYGWVTPATASDSSFFRYHFLELMTGLLLAPVHFAIIHAACVALDGHGVLLCGHSEAGKSTLSFACAQRGWTFVSDDASHVPLRNSGRMIIGSPLYLRLREDAPALFPQLRDRSLILRQNGEFGFEIPTSTLAGIRTAFTSKVDHVVFLNRNAAAPTKLSVFPKAEARRRLEEVLKYTFACKPNPGIAGNQAEEALYNPEVLQEQKASIGEILGAEVHELSYSSLHPAIDCLESLVRNGK